jgi:hypothetical protein
LIQLFNFNNSLIVNFLFYWFWLFLFFVLFLVFFFTNLPFNIFFSFLFYRYWRLFWRAWSFRRRYFLWWTAFIREISLTRDLIRILLINVFVIKSISHSVLCLFINNINFWFILWPYISSHNIFLVIFYIIIILIIILSIFFRWVFFLLFFGFFILILQIFILFNLCLFKFLRIIILICMIFWIWKEGCSMRYHRWLGCQKNIVVHDFFTIFIKINKATNIIISLWFISSLIIFKIFFIILLIMVILKILKIIIKHNFLTFFDRIFFYLLSQIIFNIECIMYIFLLRLVLNIMLSIIIHIIII